MKKNFHVAQLIVTDVYINVTIVPTKRTFMSLCFSQYILSTPEQITLISITMPRFEPHTCIRRKIPSAPEEFLRYN